MLVEIHGGGFQNKGAELMLRATVSELRHRLPEFKAAVDPICGPYDMRCELALHQIFPARGQAGWRGFAAGLRRQRLFASTNSARWLGYLMGVRLSAYGGASLAELDGLIDISGFAYTDEWGARPTQDMAVLAGYFKARRLPVIFLPQAFGPFQRNETRAAFKHILDAADLVFARDERSYSYVLELASEPSKVMRAPDITLFYPEASPVDRNGQDRSYVCVVPNVRMLDQGKQSWGDRYQPYLGQIISGLVDDGVAVRIVVHDASGQDRRLAQQICADASSPAVTVIEEQDAFALKRLLAGSSLVIGSRYHSLVAAFSGQVPALALGWSHKYDMLFRDFGCEQDIIKPQAPVEGALERARDLLRPESNEQRRRAIGLCLKDMHALNRAMWSQVAETLANRRK